MPSQINDHLEWVEITDFSKGLWSTGGSFLMPSDAFQTMTDCYPQPNGGVRAFFKRSSLGSTGLPSSGEKPIALHRQLRTTAGLIYDEYLLATTVVSTGVCKIYHRASGGVSWSLIKTFAAPPLGSAAPTQCQIINYTQSTNYLFALALFSYGGTWADEGIWTYNPATNTWSQISSTIDHAIAVYQNRLIGADGSILWWTDPDSVTFAAANYIDLQDFLLGGVSNIIGAIITQGPSNLLLSTASGWATIEGSLDDPVVREMGKNHVPYGCQNPTVQYDDVAFFNEREHGIFQIGNMGNTFDRIDPQLAPLDYDLTSTGAYGLAINGDLLFTPYGRIYSPKNGWWFTESAGVSHSTENFFSDGQETIWFVNWETGFDVQYLSTQEVSASRLSTYTLKTAPLRRPDGRQVNVREVQVFVKGNASGDSVAVTVNGTTRTASNIGTSANVLTFTFNERGEYLDVQVVPTAASTGEAPQIEGLRIGTRPDGHRLR